MNNIMQSIEANIYSDSQSIVQYSKKFNYMYMIKKGMVR